MRLTALGLALLLAITLLTGCATTKLTESWKRPGFTGKVQKVYLIGVTHNDRIRHFFEDEVARQLAARGVTGLPSYPDLVISGNVDRETLRARLRAQGTDAVLVARLVGKTQRTASFSAREAGYGIGTGPLGIYYEEFYNGSIAMVAPGPAVTSDYSVVNISANLFETESAQAVWSTLAEITASDDNREQRLRDFITKVVDKLQEDGLL
jgi:hypothetical protein